VDIRIDYAGTEFLITHSHGEAFGDEDLIAGPLDRNGHDVAKDQAVLLSAEQELLLLDRLLQSTTENRMSLANAILRFSKFGDEHKAVLWKNIHPDP